MFISFIVELGQCRFTDIHNVINIVTNFKSPTVGNLEEKQKNWIRYFVGVSCRFGYKAEEKKSFSITIYDITGFFFHLFFVSPCACTHRTKQI